MAIQALQYERQQGHTTYIFNRFQIILNEFHFFEKTLWSYW